MEYRLPNAACIAALLDRLTHHAEVTLIECDSYRMSESELEATARKKEKHGESPMLTKLNAYRQAVLDLCSRLPDTPRLLSRHDLRLVRQLCDQNISPEVIEAAFLLALARRAARRPDAMPFGPFARSTTSRPSSRNCSLSPFLNLT